MELHDLKEGMHNFVVSTFRGAVGFGSVALFSGNRLKFEGPVESHE